MQKTKFVERVWKLKPEIKIYDLDGTIIDSSHRAIVNPDGTINLEKWREMSTKDFIFGDTLLPMYWQLVSDYKMGDIIVICTARNLNEHDMNFIRAISDIVTLFHQGSIFMEDKMDVISADPNAREIYLGHKT